MEQTNLVVTPDGKTWDEVTRDTTYLGNSLVSTNRDGGDISATNYYIWDNYRGKSSGSDIHWFTKDFAIAYDRLICLVDGQYYVTVNIRGQDMSSFLMYLRLNGDVFMRGSVDSESGREGHAVCNANLNLKRGDYISVQAGDGVLEGGSHDTSFFGISRL